MYTLAGKSPLDYGTLYDSFQNTLKKYPDRPAYKIPAKKGRAYYANGFEMSWRQVNVQVQKLFIKNLDLENEIELLFYLIRDLSSFIIFSL